MQGTQMNEIWIFKITTLLPKLVAAIVGAILALVLSGDISQDGYIKITLGVALRVTFAVFISLFGGTFIIERYALTSLSTYSQGFIMFLVAVFGLLVIGIIYQSVAMLKGKTLSEIAVEVSSAFKAIFRKGVE